MGEWPVIANQELIQHCTRTCRPEPDSGSQKRCQGDTLRHTNMEVENRLFVKENGLPKAHCPLPCE